MSTKELLAELPVVTSPINEAAETREPVKSEQLVQDLATRVVASETYFHGSKYPFEKGDIIVPGDGGILGKNGQMLASATTSEEVAWTYADMKPGNEREAVYVVVPSDGERVQRVGPQYGEVNSPSFTVVDRIDTKPDHQGTFPDVNWSQYSPYISENHPEDPPPSSYNRNYPKPESLAIEPPSPHDMPLPGMGQEFVQAEIARANYVPDRPLI